MITLGVFLSFKYKNDMGKIVGHTAFIAKQGDLQVILDRYYLLPSNMFDIKFNGQRLTNKENSQIQNRFYQYENKKSAEQIM